MTSNSTALPSLASEHTDRPLRKTSYRDSPVIQICKRRRVRLGPANVRTVEKQASGVMTCDCLLRSQESIAYNGIVHTRGTIAVCGQLSGFPDTQATRVVQVACQLFDPLFRLSHAIVLFAVPPDPRLRIDLGIPTNTSGWFQQAGSFRRSNTPASYGTSGRRHGMCFSL